MIVFLILLKQIKGYLTLGRKPICDNFTKGENILDLDFFRYYLNYGLSIIFFNFFGTKNIKQKIIP